MTAQPTDAAPAPPAEASAVTTERRLLAAATLLLAAVTLALALAAIVTHFPRGLVVTGLVLLAVIVAWQGLLRGGRVRTLALAAAAVLVAGAVVVIVTGGPPLAEIATVVAALLTLAAARATFAVRASLPPAARPERAVLIWNPRSGGGKAERFHLADEARARGIEPVELRPGDDLVALVHEAVDRGADGLAVAGGDGSQAIVAAIAAERGLPYACIPAGTRNHFALDLGVDRDDVVGALVAFVGGGERMVDLAEVNGRVFVNNVSLGVYAEAVQQAGYRDAKVRTILDTIPTAMGSGAGALDLRWRAPDGSDHATHSVLLVSNNPYRLGRPVGSGTRPRIDSGLLGITVLDDDAGEGRAGRSSLLRRPWQEWSAAEFEVRAEGQVAAGVDGEALKLAAPLRFRIRPAALRVRVAPQHPGASPSAAQPDGLGDAVRKLVRLAAGRERRLGLSP